MLHMCTWQASVHHPRAPLTPHWLAHSLTHSQSQNARCGAFGFSILWPVIYITFVLFDRFRRDQAKALIDKATMSRQVSDAKGNVFGCVVRVCVCVCVYDECDV